MNIQILANIIFSSAHIWLMAIGFGIIYRIIKFFHFTHAAVYIVSAYTAYTVTSYVTSNALYGITVGIITAVVVGVLIEIVVFRPLRRAKASAATLLIASLGVLVALQNVVSLIFGDDTKNIFWSSLPPQVLVIGHARVTMVQIILLVVALATTSLLAIFLTFTRQGLILRAVASETALAQCVGINVNAAILVSFLIGSSLAGIAGVLWAGNTALIPSMGFTALLTGTVAAIAGGIGSLLGSFVGAALIAIAQHLILWRFPGQWQDAIVFLILILFLLIRPQGIFGKPLRKTTV